MHYCDVCGKSWVLLPPVIHAAHPSSTFCSQKCAEAFHAKFVMLSAYQQRATPQPQGIPNGISGLGSGLGTSIPGATYPIWPPSPYLARAVPTPTSTSGISPATVEALKKVEPHRVGPRVPDLVEPIVGWRAWRSPDNSIDPASTHLWTHLWGIGTAVRWEPKKALEAKCINAMTWNPTPPPPFHKAPDKDCACGIWAFRDLDALMKATASYPNINVFGQVYLWGRVLECDGGDGPSGYRAQMAYPKELWLTDPALEYLGRDYNVPVRVLEAK